MKCVQGIRRVFIHANWAIRRFLRGYIGVMQHWQEVFQILRDEDKPLLLHELITLYEQRFHNINGRSKRQLMSRWVTHCVNRGLAIRLYPGVYKAKADFG